MEALRQAAQGKGSCAPNPAVGAVLVRQGVAVAQGFHAGPGQPHAEVNALADYEGPVDGSTLYVTLEPCCHWGRTPPCTDLILKRKIPHVIFGHLDPNPVVAGKGSAQLAAAGIAAEYRPLPEIAAFYRSYDHWTSHRTPWVTAKLALSLDGKSAAIPGRLRLTGEEAAAFTHEERRQADAILTTAQTVIADDPQMNARVGEERMAKTIYVIDRDLKTPLSAQLISHNQKVTLFCGEEASFETEARWQEKGVSILRLPTVRGRFDWRTIFQRIGETGAHDLWIEAGGTTFSELLSGGHLQRAFLYIAPCIVGPAGIAAFEQPVSLASAASVRWRSLGKDVVCEILW